MPTLHNRRFLRTRPAFIMVGFLGVIALAGMTLLGRPHAVRADSDPVHRVVEIRVTPDGRIEAIPDQVVVNRPRGERVEWRCSDGRFRVAFDKNGSPFGDTSFGAGRGEAARSGRVRSDIPAGRYSYSIWVWTAEDRPPVYLDPGANVEDDGG